MTNQEIEHEVAELSKTYAQVEVFMWDRATEAMHQTEASGLAEMISSLSDSQEIAGSIYYNGDEKPQWEIYTQNENGVQRFNEILAEVEDRQADLRAE